MEFVIKFSQFCRTTKLGVFLVGQAVFGRSNKYRTKMMVTPYSLAMSW